MNPVEPIQIGALTELQLSTIIAAVIGFLGGFLSSFGLYWIRRKNKRRKLRRAIYAELIACDWIPQIGNRKVEQLKNPDERPRNTNIPHKIYDSHRQDIGLLSIAEIERIVDFYDTAYMAEEELGIMLNPEINNDSRTREKFVDKTYPRLVQSYNSSKESLEKHLNIDDRTRDEYD